MFRMKAENEMTLLRMRSKEQRNDWEIKGML
jgi:hypothetical protein